MLLDAMLASPDIVWLATPDEKVAHLSTLTRIPLNDLPHVTIGHGDERQVQYFPDRLPLGVHPEGRAHPVRKCEFRPDPGSPPDLGLRSVGPCARGLDCGSDGRSPVHTAASAAA